MSSISELYNKIITLMNQNFSQKTDVDNKISSHNTSLTAHSSEMAKKVDISQGSNNASKNVVTDGSGNITLESKPVIPSKTSDLTNDSNYITTNDSRLSDARTPLSHTHNTGEVSDTSAYTNIGSAANATQKTINDKINTALGNKANSNNVYSKSETYTQSEITTAISNAVSNLQLFEVVTSLPTSNIKPNRLYLVVNGKSISENQYDIYLRVNNQWEKLDSLEFDISNFYNKTETDNLLDGKCDNDDSRLSNARTPTSHSHGDITNTGAIGTTANKPLITSTNGKIATGSFGTSANTFAEGNHTHDWDELDYTDKYTGWTLLESNEGRMSAIGISYDTDNEELYFPCLNLYDNDGVQLATLDDIAGKVNINQGTANNGKFLKVDSTGKVACESVTIPSAYTHPTTKQCSYSYTHPSTQQCSATIPTKTSQLTNDSGFLTSHQDISGKAPNNHASTSTTYGVATTSAYGHVKVANNLTTSSFSASAPVVLTAYQGKLLKGYVDAKLSTATYSNGSLTVS